MFVANGAVKTLENLAARGDPYPLHQPNQLFHNRGGGSFVEVNESELPLLAVSEVSRGTIAGDLDGDGGVDLIILNNCGPARILRARTPTPSEWVGFDLRDRNGRSPAIGTEVAVTTASGRVIKRRVRVAASYLCANDPRVVVGLRRGIEGKGTEGLGAELPLSIQVTYAGGETASFGALAPGQYHTIVRGELQPRDHSPTPTRRSP